MFRPGWLRRLNRIAITLKLGIVEKLTGLRRIELVGRLDDGDWDILAPVQLKQVMVKGMNLVDGMVLVHVDCECKVDGVPFVLMHAVFPDDVSGFLGQMLGQVDDEETFVRGKGVDYQLLFLRRTAAKFDYLCDRDS